MKKLIREYEENGKQMQEFEVTTGSGKTHIVRKPKQAEPTIEQLLEQLRQKYIKLIRDAQDLGETEEVTRLQNEYQVKKAEIEAV